ncbi:MFS transporter [Paraburkholderia oxyphila]|uniref:MFS transporter n=1 Tax=Paraburkholderia oxyphila TaxID=614212 RepID=UPI000A02D3EC|nr:MFS transporter [Paraburkholderia oxyphila]
MESVGRSRVDAIAAAQNGQGRLDGSSAGPEGSSRAAFSANRPQWILTGAIVLVAINLRPGIVSIGPILPAIQASFGLTHATASLLTAIPDLLMGLLALPTPWLARRFGRSSVLLSALIILLASTVIRGLAPNTITLLATTGGVGAGIAISGSLFGGLIKERFPTKSALLMGIYATALSLGGAVAAASTGVLANVLPGGWRTAAGIWGLLSIVGIIGWRMVGSSDVNGGTQPVVSPKPGLPFTNFTAWMIALFFACVNFLFYALVSWIAPMYQELGLSTKKAGFVLASFMIVFTCANPVIGWLSKGHDRRGWLLVCGALVVGGLAGIALAPNVMPVLWVGLIALGLGGAFTLGMTLPLDNTNSAEEANSWTAFAMLVAYLIAAAGPLGVGILRDLTGGFGIPMLGLLIFGFAMMAFAPFLKPGMKG